ncbi:MAG: hypothetical protein QXN87_02235 [Candidatus Bathyarchaeia archaeon]
MPKHITPVTFEDDEYEMLKTLKFKLYCSTWRQLILKLAEMYLESCPQEERVEIKPEIKAQEKPRITKEDIIKRLG